MVLDPLKHTYRFGLSAILACGLAVSASANDAQSMAERFTIYLGGIKAAKLALSASFEGSSFSSRSVLKTTGLLKIFYSGFYTVAADGQIDASNTLKPATFEADSAFGDDRQQVRVTFNDLRPTTVEAKPKFKPKAHQIVPQEQSGVIDPLTAALTLMRPEPVAKLCNRSVDVFDGRRRSRITMSAPKTVNGQIRCETLYEKVAGFSEKSMKRAPSFDFIVAFRERPDGLAEVVQISGDTGYGLAVISRQ